MSNHIHLPFIEMMPDKPSEKPLDWNFISNRFHDYVMNEHNKVKFTDPDGYVRFGAFVEDGGHELITFGGIVLGKILRGDDVEAYLPSLKTYFSQEHSIFLNHPYNTKEEYWYLMYVNCLAFEIIRKSLSDQEEYLEMIRQSLNTLMNIATINGYDFNDQGFDFETKRPFTRKDSYRQPDTIGAYSYLMLVGYEQFGDGFYLREAVKALSLYASFKQNPWYEIPNGAMACLAAAKLNRLGFSFDVNRILSFVFDAEEGPLHIGKWGNAEVNGLMRGWRGYSREEASKTAYSLETFLPIPFLLPLIHDDVRFAKWIGKYVLHVAANSRLFFQDYMPKEAQSRPELPPDVPYETLHVHKHGHSPYAFGDFHTHKSVYGGALTLWLDAIIQQTDDPFILQLDITKTDFLGKHRSKTYVYYNPWEVKKTITLEIANDQYDLFDLASNQFLPVPENGTIKLSIPPKDTRVIRLLSMK